MMSNTDLLFTGSEPLVNQLSLATLPIEVLQEITRRIHMSTICYLFIAGDLCLNRQLCLGGVQSFAFSTSPTFSPILWPSCIAHFHYMRHFALTTTGQYIPDGERLRDLPRGLESLSLTLPDGIAMFLLLYIPDHRLVPRNTPTLKDIFPSLKSFHLCISPQSAEQTNNFWNRLIEALPSTLTQIHFEGCGSEFTQTDFNLLPNLTSLEHGGTQARLGLEFPPGITKLHFPHQCEPLVLLDIKKLLCLTELHLKLISSSEEDRRANNALLDLPPLLTFLHLNYTSSSLPVGFFSSLPRGLLDLELVSMPIAAEDIMASPLPPGLRTFRNFLYFYRVIEFKNSTAKPMEELVLDYIKCLPASLETISLALPVSSLSTRSQFAALPKSLREMHGVYLKLSDPTDLSALPSSLRNIVVASEQRITASHLSAMPKSIRHISGNVTALSLEDGPIMLSLQDLRVINNLILDNFAVVEEEEGSIKPTEEELEELILDSDDETPIQAPSKKISKTALVQFSRFMPPLVEFYELLLKSSNQQQIDKFVLDFTSSTTPQGQAYPENRAKAIQKINLKAFGSAFEINPSLLVWKGIGVGLATFKHLTSFRNRVFLLDRTAFLTLMTSSPNLTEMDSSKIGFAIEDKDLSPGVLPGFLTLFLVLGIPTKLTVKGVSRLPRSLIHLALPPSPECNWQTAGMTLEEIRAIMPPEISLCDIPQGINNESSCWSSVPVI